MNKNSKICCFIKQNTDWKDILKRKYGITIKEEYPYAIFNYGINSDFSNPIVQEARGIIINAETLEVACWPFRKFGNYNETYADNIDWSTARVQEKIDGSIIKMWWNPTVDEWQFSTNSTINAKEALANSLTKKTFLDVIKESDNYGILTERLPVIKKDYTLIFELVSPDTQVVVKYENSHLYHIGARNNATGMEEKNFGVGIEKPKEYSLKSLNDCIDAAVKLNQSKDGKVCKVKKEGFVVVDDNWNRIKIKSPDYLMLHRLSSNGNFSKERIVGLLRNKTISVKDICEEFPNFSHYFKYYDFKVSELEYQANVFCDLTKRIYEEYSHDRKAVALLIKNHKLAPLGFMCLDSGKSGKEILSEMQIRKYCKYILDYEPERFSKLFYREID